MSHEETAQYVKQACGHGHGPLMEIPGHGLRCPACFPELFLREVELLRRMVARFAATEPGDTNGSFDPVCAYCGQDCGDVMTHGELCPWRHAVSYGDQISVPKR